MLRPHHPAPADVLDAAATSVADLQQRLWAAVSDEELLEAAESLETLVAQAAAVRAHLLTEIDQRDLARTTLSWASTHDWYAHLAGTTTAAAHHTLRTAHALTTDLQATYDALAAGRISPDQAGVITRAVTDLPTDPDVRHAGEQALLAEAAHLNATDLRKAARHLLEVVDPDHDARKTEAALDREERAAHLQRFLSLTDDGAGGIRIKGRGSIEDGATLRAALIPLTTPSPALDPDHPHEPTESDPRDHGARLWDALVGIAQHSLDTEVQPADHGARPRVGVLIDLDDLRQQTGTGAVTDDGLTLSAATTRRLACDADILPLCLGTDGQVLDVGRTHRLVTMALWLALIARDHHCTFPGCTRPPVMCHAHHIDHWANGGKTSLDNLVMLCGTHHRVIHHSPWQVRLSPHDRRPEFRPPPRRHDHPPPPDTWLRHRPRRE